jgi:thiol:disulfide interchange protein
MPTVLDEPPLIPPNYVETVPPADVEPWNPKGIAWQPFEQGLAQAKKENKPICLVLFTTWCGHCKNYSHIFGDPRLVARAKQFVMIRVDADANEAVSKRYSSDGTYVPRTFLLESNGNVNPAAHSDHPRYKHFFDEMHADSLLEAMNDALVK